MSFLKQAAFIANGNGNGTQPSFPKWPVNDSQTVDASDMLSDHKSSRSHSEMFCELGVLSTRMLLKRIEERKAFIPPQPALPGTCELDTCPFCCFDVSGKKKKKKKNEKRMEM